jgi:hypothetical protein
VNVPLILFIATFCWAVSLLMLWAMLTTIGG